MDKLFYNCSAIPNEFIGNNSLEIDKKRKMPINISSIFEKSSLIFELIYESIKGKTIKLIDIKK